jgi:hypothetical protein
MRHGKHTVLVVVCAVAMLICGCGKKDTGDNQTPTSGQSPSPESAKQTPATPQPQTQPQAQPQTPTDGTSGTVPSAAGLSADATKNQEILTQLNQGKQITAVTADTLKGMLPETLAGMKRTDASAEQNQAMGINMTIAEAQYEGENEASADLTITDIGNMTGMMRTGMTAWTMAQYDRKTDSGYEKTATFGGYKGMEEYENEGKHGTIRVFVADRFVVELNGRGVTMDALKKALDQVDLKKIAALVSGS